MNFSTLLECYPDIALDRHCLSFSRRAASADIAEAYARAGVVMLKDAMPPTLLERAAYGFRQCLQAAPVSPTEANAHGSWHSPWLLRLGDFFPAADILGAIVRSWIWDVVEELCQTSQIVLLLKFCTARHSVDDSLGLGAHQDAKVVEPSVPMSLWIPLQDIVPRRCSGLGFVVPHPNCILPTSADNDVGEDYLLSEPASLWMPSYALGDLSIHSRFAVHYTTGFGTGTDRYSLEVRAMPRLAAPSDHLDPALYVARRNGVPSFVRAHSSLAEANAFLKAALAAAPVDKG